MRKIAVAGGGTMGRGIAEAFLRSGFDVLLLVRDREKIADLERTLASVFGDRVAVTADYSACAGRELVIEAVAESVEAKAGVLRRVSTIAAGGVVASTTSSIPVSVLAAFSPDPSRFLGLHFFNPAVKMKGVEVIPGPQTSPETLARALAFVREAGKEPVVVKDGPGFVTTRLLMAYFVEAMWMLDEGHDPSSVDAAMVTCVKMGMGPCAMMDLIGLDVIGNILAILNRESGSNRFTPPPFFYAWLRAGRLGRKSGHGFFSYDGGVHAEVMKS